MSVANNHSSVKALKAKAVSYMSAMALMLIICLVNTINARATVPIPSGFTSVTSGTGVRVYSKINPYGYYDYVTIVDLRRATLVNFTGWVSGNQPENGLIERRSIKTHWSNAVAQNTSSKKALVAINGTFFATNDSPSAISFGLKMDWWRASYGYAVNQPNEFPGQEMTLAFDSGFGSSSIQSHSRSTFDGAIPNVVGGLTVTADKGKTQVKRRTFVGVRDDDGNGHSETVIFYSSTGAPQDWAVKILSGFGAGSKMMLDGGSSTGLIVGGSTYIAPSYSLPHVFMVFSGK